ncbi:sensor histidine kinase [Limoniibacter endophyticus]|uniref:histidine kinase n=1 Tax=Limoniibacter endophyticus TaxID=1565040 RepID=A0A8J3DKX0_9HYPH|nr:sensor histidine kinase [Limoniibacter endophyticus]GHC77821.1 histidine kinase [Limoniibacter endophyticus]
MTRRGYSLRRRLLLWLVVAAAAIGMIALIDTWREATRTANAVSDRVLSGSALAIAERVIVNELGSLDVDIPYVALEMLTSTAQDRVFYRVDGPPGNFITGYSGLPTVETSVAGSPAYRDAIYRSEPVRVATLMRFASTGINSVPFTVTVAETTNGRRQLANAFIWRSALRLSALILAALTIVAIALTFALRPFYKLEQSIRRLTPSDLDPIEEQGPREVRNITATINGFMERLASALFALRNFTGNAGHQLRTPLAVVRTQLALAQRAETLEDAKFALKKGDEQVAYAERILAQLLLMSRIEGAPAAMQIIDLAEIARQHTAERIPDAAAHRVDLGYEGEETAIVEAEPLLLGELIRNLIDNAMLYGGSGCEVTVRVREIADRVSLTVEDTGAGVDAATLQRLGSRFARGTDQGAHGAGLGLAIVAEIAALFRGRMVLAQGADGAGFKVEISFPAASMG